MTQLLEALICLHENNIYFPIGGLTEERIYLNLMCSECYLDPDFINFEANPKFKIIPPEYQDKNDKAKPTKHSDTFSLGIIFLRLITFTSIENIANLLQKEPTNSNKSKPIFPKKKKDKFGDFSSSFNVQSFNDIESKVFSEIYKSTAHDEIKKIVFEMLRPADKRPKLRDAKIRLLTLKGIFEKQEVEGVIASYKSPTPQLIPMTPLEEPTKEEDVNKNDTLNSPTSVKKKTEESFNLAGFLSDPDLRPSFQAFLASEFAQEPILFLIAVEKYKLQTENRLDLVNEIYDNFINTQTAKTEINVTHRLKKLFSKDMEYQMQEKNFRDDLFDGLLNHVVGKSLQEPFLRFKKTEKFSELKKKYL